ncbi:MAG: bifunctional pyr operon transcriptional regulator/uracil phosphoribosyltransferase PyrR [Planctomycetota bacterium]|nr:MAG: bifunctional pyr operon transcriptional regulator/uracil phosphoribosyltransferase PyrR [Planctomycetota bacterium]
MTRILLDENGIRETLERLAGEIAASIPSACTVAIVGIRRRGDELARRLLPLFEKRGVKGAAYGSLDITLYRDDLAEIGPSAVVRTTEIDFDIGGTYLVLVDDVIYTGRSTRAALQALIDLGRPRAIRLAVLVDRGGREFPIQPDFTGIRAPSDNQHVTVFLTETDGFDRVEVFG